MKRKKTDWSRVPWTAFEPVTLPTDELNGLDPPAAVFRNSRYQVTVYVQDGEPFGQIAHLSIKTLDKQPHHDWRDFQRIKNEICDPECDAVEVYPRESRLVDCANQFHVFVFQTYKLPFGFDERLVSDGNWKNSVQRPFPLGERPADCLTAAEFEVYAKGKLAERLKKKETVDGDDSSV